MISDQVVDTKVAALMEKVEALRLKAKAKQDQAAAFGGYKTNCSLDFKGRKVKISTLELEDIIEVGEWILVQDRVRSNTVERLQLDVKISPKVNKFQDYTVDDWFHDLRICVLKREALVLIRKADSLEKQTLSLESDLNKRNRAADALSKALEDDDLL